MKRRPTVLAIDDGSPFIRALCAKLGQRCRILVVRDTVTALTCLTSEDVDLVLLGSAVDHFDTISLLRRLRTLGPRPPGIAIFSRNPATMLAAAMLLGAVIYVTQPSEEDNLLSIIEASLHVPTVTLRTDVEDQPHGLARVLFARCAVGRTAALRAALSSHMRLDVAASRGDLLDCLASASPDLVVLDAAADLGVPHLLPSIESRCPSGSIILIDVPPGREYRAVASSNRYTLLSAPTGARDLLEEMRVQLAQHGGRLPRFSDQVAGVIDYMQTGFADADVTRLGRHLGKSPYYLSRLFRIETGMTLKRYVHRVKIEAARQLLIATTDKIETVAARVGLHDASHLSRIFLKYSGMRPGDFRRAQRHEANAG